MVNKIILSFTGLIIGGCLNSYAGDPSFEKTFSDSTLRVDYIFAGGPGGHHIFLDSQTRFPGWAGRRNNLKATPVKGNGNIMVTDPESGDTLYNNCFSTLFQEWISTPEASVSSQSFENSFLVPLPRRAADITVSLRDNRGDEIASLTHSYRPDDVLVRNSPGTPLSPRYLHKGNESSKAVDLVILAEGYTEAEMDDFMAVAERIGNEILSYEPFASNKDKFNILAVAGASEESGVSIPSLDSWKNTRYGSHFSTFYSERYLTVPRVWKMHRDLEGIPYESVLVLVNTDKYGGGGIFNSYQVASSKNEFTLPVSVHEFGHSFTGLADEYDYDDNEDTMYPLDIEPWEPNITTLVDFSSKWQDMIDESVPVPTPWQRGGKEGKDLKKVTEMKVGAYEGAGYKRSGVFRPTVTCRMRDNYYPSFCPVCEKALLHAILFYTE